RLGRRRGLGGLGDRLGVALLLGFLDPRVARVDLDLDGTHGVELLLRADDLVHLDERRRGRLLERLLLLGSELYFLSLPGLAGAGSFRPLSGLGSAAFAAARAASSATTRA